MGYYKNIETELQNREEYALSIGDSELADTLAWYRAHFDKLPPELLTAILNDDAFFRKALIIWDNKRFSPKPASEHVALQPSRRDLRKPRGSWKCVIGWSLIGLSLATSVTILAVNL